MKPEIQMTYSTSGGDSEAELIMGLLINVYHAAISSIPKVVDAEYVAYESWRDSLVDVHKCNAEDLEASLRGYIWDASEAL
jgi:hypothetical protein